jgi:hypothetical protein
MFPLFVPDIPLRTVCRPSEDFNLRWSKIREAEHLPRRLFIGDLETDSFQKTPDGWQADYRSGGLFLLRLSRKNATIHVEESFQATPVLRGSFHAELRGSECLQAYVRNPGAFDGVLESYYYSAQDNLIYIPQAFQGRSMAFCHFPDGFFQTVVLPIPFRRSRCSAVVDVLADLSKEDAVPVHGLLKFQHAATYHLQGRFGEITDNVWDHYKWLLSQGYWPMKWPYWTKKPQVLGLISHYCCYLLHLTFAMRDGPQIVGLLRKHGLLGAPGESVDKYAVMLHAHEAAFMKHIEVDTRDRSRRLGIPLDYNEETERERSVQSASGSSLPAIDEIRNSLDRSLASYGECRRSMVGIIDIIVRQAYGDEDPFDYPVGR